jgi:hypothetical protein
VIGGPATIRRDLGIELHGGTPNERFQVEVSATEADQADVHLHLRRDFEHRRVAAIRRSGGGVLGERATNFHLTVGRPSCAALWPAIFAMLAFLRLLDRPDRWKSIWLAAAVAATMMADQQTMLFCACWLLATPIP